MPIRTIRDTEIQYYLLSYDENGHERREPDGSLLSETVCELVDKHDGITDVFFISHGWKGDIGAAIEQYDNWVGAMARNEHDLRAARAARPGWKPLVIGLHWPSLPFGNESMASGLLGTEGNEQSIEEQIDQFAVNIADTPKARAALNVILNAANADEPIGDSLPPDVKAAYETLYAESKLDSGDVDSAPGADHETWDPDGIFEDALSNTSGESHSAASGLLSFGSGLGELLVAPARQLSFWKMKDRARKFGEAGAHQLLTELQRRASSNTHFHLMGHSFGSIVVSATIAGPPNGAALENPVHSLYLVQGALSLWSYCEFIECADNKPGYFHRIIADKLVEGPIVTTRSSKDSAVGRLYPTAARLAGQVLLGDELPRYGGVGTYGLQGLGQLASDLRMEDDNFNYDFARGRVYNIEASDVIKVGTGFSGAHSDITHAEVAHVMWQAALSR